MFSELNTALVAALKTSAGGDPLGQYPIFELHPMQLSGYLEAVWEAWRRFGEGTWLSPPAGTKAATSAEAVIPALGTVEWGGVSPGLTAGIVGAIEDMMLSRDGYFGPWERSPPGPTRKPLDVKAAATVALEKLFTPAGRSNTITAPWRHLMYAYLIENTRAFDVFERVLQDAFHDETLGVLSQQTLRWIRITEDLFFRDGPSSLIYSITSSIRPDPRATRRNAYHRMFGIDLNHGSGNGGAYNYLKAASANAEFVRTLQDLLREVWRGFINSKNSSGPNMTDTGAIRELMEKLEIMMNARRLSSGGSGRANLAREEFVSVAMMSWFDLVLTADTAVILDLRAHASQPEDRLRKVGERMRLPSHGKSRSFFILANGSTNQAPYGLPHFLREIEEGVWDTTNLSELFDQTSGITPLVQRTIDIVNHWSIATGVDMKSVPVNAPRTPAFVNVN